MLKSLKFKCIFYTSDSVLDARSLFQNLIALNCLSGQIVFCIKQIMCTGSKAPSDYTD